MKNHRPNILWISTDQQRWDYLSHFGTPGLRTPHLDRLAREGQIYPNCYTVSPICTPCRVSLLTGLYPSRHGAVSLGSVGDFHHPTIADLLGGAGYRTGLIGKSHFVPRKAEPAHALGSWHPGDPLPEDDAEAYQTDQWRDIRRPYCGFDTYATSRNHNADSRPDQHYRAWLEAKGADLDEIDLLHGRARDQKVGRWELPARYHQNTWTSEESIRFMREARSEGRAWFCWASYQDPHSPYVCPDPWFGQVSPETAPPPSPSHADKPAFYDLLVQRGIFEDGARRFYEEGQGVPHTINGSAMSDDEKIAARRAYKAMCNFIDDSVGELIRHLESTGELDNTYIVFTSDHGDFLGDHGLWYKGLPAFDAGQRVPLVVWSPKAKCHGQRDALISLIDLPATTLAWAGLPPPDTFQGHDHSGVFAGESDGLRDSLLVECNATRRVNQITLVTEAWKLVTYHNLEEGELYDRHTDPAQEHNLWADPDHRQTRDQLLQRLVRETLARDARQNARLANA